MALPPITVIAVELIDEEIDLYDIEVPGDESFLAEGVVAHNTSKVCRARAGMVYEMGVGPLPPAHPRCRSTIVGLAVDPKTGKPLLEAMNDVGYDEWLREQSPAVQEDVLGVAKAKLFRLGKLPIDGFVDATGKELTLDQLRVKERAAWERAFLPVPEQKALSVARRLNSLVGRSSPDVRPYAETFQRAWDWLRFKSSDWLEAASALRRAPVSEQLIYDVAMLDFFTGAPTVNWRLSGHWRHAVRRGTQRANAAAVVHVPPRLPRGLSVHPPIRPRGPDGPDLPPPIKPPPAPTPPGTPTDKPRLPPPITPDSIILPPGRGPRPPLPDGPPPGRPPLPSEKPGIRTPTAVDDLPDVAQVSPKDNVTPPLPKVADDVRTPAPPSPVQTLPEPQQPLPPLSTDLTPPKNPVSMTVKEIETALDGALPPEGFRGNADDALKDLVAKVTRDGTIDGIRVVDDAGTPLIEIKLGEKDLTGAVTRWRSGTHSWREPMADKTPAPDVTVKLPLARPPPPAVTPVTRDVAEVARAELEAAIKIPSSSANVRPLYRAIARDKLETEARLTAGRRAIQEALADLDEINAGLEGRRGIAQALQAKADFLQRLAIANRLEAPVTVYRPLRWGTYEGRFGDSPARLTGVVLEPPSFLTATTNEGTALVAGARRGKGALVLMRLNLRAGDSALAGNPIAGELVLPAGARLHVNGVTRLPPTKIPAELRAKYPKDQAFYLADTELVRPGESLDRAITRTRAEQERILRSLRRRTARDSAAEDALAHTPFAPFQQDSTHIDVWPVFDPKTGTMRVNPKVAVEAADAGPLFRRAEAQMINRAGRSQPLSNAIAGELEPIGERALKAESMGRAVRRLRESAFRADNALPIKPADAIARVKDELDIDVRLFGEDVAGAIANAILKRDMVSLARMSGQLADNISTQGTVSASLPSSTDLAAVRRGGRVRGFGDWADKTLNTKAYRDRAAIDRAADAIATAAGSGGLWHPHVRAMLPPDRWVEIAAELGRGHKLYADLVQALTRGKAGIEVGVPGEAAVKRFAGAREAAADAFEAWYGLQYSASPVWRRIMEHMAPDLDDTMRKVIDLRRAEPFPDVWTPTLKLTHNRRIVSDLAAETRNVFADTPTLAQAAGVRDAVRARFYDMLEAEVSLAARAQGKLAKDLGVSKADVEVLIKEAQQAGWITGSGRGIKVAAPAARGPRPAGRPALEPSDVQRAGFYDYLEGKGAVQGSSLSQAAVKQLARELGLNPAQMNRLQIEAQTTGWLRRDPNGALRRTWGKDQAPPMRPTAGDIARVQGTSGTPAHKIDPAEAPRAAVLRARAQEDLDDVLRGIASEMRGVPLDTAAARLPVRSESERVMVDHVWRHAALDQAAEAAIRGAEQVILTRPSDTPTFYDPTTGTINTGKLDPSLPGDQVMLRHEFGTHLDLPMTPDGLIKQYSADAKLGLPKALKADADALVAGYDPGAGLRLAPDVAIARLRQEVGLDVTGIADKALAHALAEHALTGNAALLKAVEAAVRRGVVKDARLRAELLALADLTAAVTKNRLGLGHPESYFAGGFEVGGGYTSRHANEVFANWFALHTSPATGWRKILEKQFPAVNEAARKILERMGKDAGG